MPVYQEKNKSKCTKDGRSWYFRVYYTNFNGQKKQYESGKYFSKKDALEEERKFILNVSKHIDNKNLKFKDLYELFYQHQKTRVKATTFQTYIYRVPFLEPLNEMKCVDFNVNVYEEWRKWLDKKNIATSYKNDIQKFLKCILNYAEKWHNYNFRSVYTKMEKFIDPGEIPKEMDFYTFEEFNKFISFENELLWICLFETLYYCGLRNGEMRALTWDDIDWDKKTIKITKQIPTCYSSRNWKFTSLKTKSSIRTLPICNILYEHLKLLHAEAKSYKNFQNNWFVFGNAFPIVADKPNEHQKKICAKSNVKKIRIHDFRHSCASLLIANGADVTIVSKYLGHSKIDETLKTYAHMFQNKLNNIVSIINHISTIYSSANKALNDNNIQISDLISLLLSKGYNTETINIILNNLEKSIK